MQRAGASSGEILELPILDGSARPFVEMIPESGSSQQRRPRKYLKICRELELRDGNKFNCRVSRGLVLSFLQH